MFRRALALGSALALGALIAALVVAATQPPLATLGKQPIRESDFQRYLARTQSPQRVAEIRRDARLRAEALNAYLDVRAIARKAEKVGVDRNERFRKAVELAQMKILAQLLSARHRDLILKRAAVSPAEVRAYYEHHKHEFQLEPRFTAHHLLVYVTGNPAFPDQGLSDAAARRKTSEAQAQLRSGKSWQEVAQRYSDDVGTRQSGGLLLDRQFGYFAPEVEQALRTQPLGKPSDIIRTVFGYHVVEVKERIDEGTLKPFEAVSEMLKARLTQERMAEARIAFMTPLWNELGFRRTEAATARRDAPLLDETAVPPDEVLAYLAGKPITESDFRWFCNDALLPSQRPGVYSRSGARRAMLDSFLDMRVLQAKALKERLDTTPEYRSHQAAAEEQLLREFLEQHDQFNPRNRRWSSPEERQRAERAYLNRVRAEVELTRHARN